MRKLKKNVYAIDQHSVHLASLVSAEFRSYLCKLIFRIESTEQPKKIQATKTLRKAFVIGKLENKQFNSNDVLCES